MKHVIVWEGDLDDEADFMPVIIEDEDRVEWRRSDDVLFGIHFYNVDHASRFGLVQLPLLNQVQHKEAI